MAEETNELWSTLMRFHREVAMPEMREIVSTTVDSAVGALRNEMNTHFDGIYTRLDRLDVQFAALHGAGAAARRPDGRPGNEDGCPGKENGLHRNEDGCP